MNEFEKMFSLIHNQIEPNIDFLQFKDILIDYSEKVMKSFLNGQALCRCYIKPLKEGHKGSESYNEKTNTFEITISEKVIKSIYEGTNPFNIFIVFHEISHVYDEFNIQNKNFKDANLKKICIEDAISESIPRFGSMFYRINYESTAIEAHANLIAAQLTRDFYKKCNIEFDEMEQKGLLFLEFFSLQRLNNTDRDYRYLFDGSNFNSYKLPLSEILSEIENRYPNIYIKLKKVVGEENLVLEGENKLTEFENKLYEEFAILELSDIIKNPLFVSLVEEKTQYRPKL